MPIRKNFKFATVMLRLALSRVLPKFVAPPVFFMIQVIRFLSPSPQIHFTLLSCDCVLASCSHILKNTGV